MGMRRSFWEIRVGNPKERDPFKVPSLVIFHSYDNTSDERK
jgi:hypothetical protein